MTRHHLYRICRQEGGRIGHLYLTGFDCWTLAADNEYTVPDGVYTLRLVTSGRFGPGTIWICREPGVEYAQAGHHNLIHALNYATQSTGCEGVAPEISTLGRDYIGGPVPGASARALARVKEVVQDGDELEIGTLPIL